MSSLMHWLPSIIPPQSSFALLEDAARRESVNVRLTAIEALAAHDSLKVLSNALDDPVESVRTQANRPL